MSKIVHYIGLDVHKESIAVSIAPMPPVVRENLLTRFSAPARLRP